MRTVSFKKLAKEEGKLERSIKQEGKKKSSSSHSNWSFDLNLHNVLVSIWSTLVMFADSMRLGSITEM